MEDVDSNSGLITPTEEVGKEDTADVEAEVVGSSPPLLMGVSPPEEVGLVVDDESGRAVRTEVEVTNVVDVDPGAAVILITGVTEEVVLDDVGPVGATVVVVEDVRPPPGAEVRHVSGYLYPRFSELTFCCSTITYTKTRAY